MSAFGAYFPAGLCVGDKVLVVHVTRGLIYSPFVKLGDTYQGDDGQHQIVELEDMHINPLSNDFLHVWTAP